MACQPVFSPYQLDDASLANERFITESCVDNRVKFSLFTVSILAFGLVFVCSSTLFIRTIDDIRAIKLNTKKYIHLLVIVGSLTELISNIITMAGVYNRYRYFAHPVGVITIIAATHVLVWYSDLTRSLF